jgi:metallo-beta-lactamase class B
VIRSDGQHAEWFWRREFEAAYRWLQGQAMAPLGMQKALGSLSVYPNPVRGICRIGWDKEESNGFQEGRLLLRDHLGKVVLRLDSIQLPVSLDLSNYPLGVYALEWKNTQGQRSMARLFVGP